jgi:hypothetical protein
MNVANIMPPQNDEKKGPRRCASDPMFTGQQVLSKYRHARWSIEMHVEKSVPGTQAAVSERRFLRAKSERSYIPALRGIGDRFNRSDYEGFL